MSLYRVTSEQLTPVTISTFEAEKLFERKDLQRWLRKDIALLDKDLMVIAEEYGEWEDSRRRIDLLCLGRSGEIVVVEIKRTEDGGHMELQALRYAAMVSIMRLDQLVQAYARTSRADVQAARSEILEFLRVDSEEEFELSGNVKIILVSADFSPEVTTTVLWLNKRDLDITCIRLVPYRLGEDILVDVTQIIPLKEAADYSVKLKALERDQKKVESAREDFYRRFWTQLVDRSKASTQLLAGRNAPSGSWISTGIGRSGISLVLSITQTDNEVEIHIRLDSEERSKAAFDALLARRKEIDAVFGEGLDWRELPGLKRCSIAVDQSGGWKSPESEWPMIQDRMISALVRMDKAFRQPIQELNL